MKRAAWVSVLVLVSSVAWGAGETTGRIAGKVTDPTGVALPYITVSLSGTAQLGTAVRETAKDGTFAFESLAPGVDYVVQVTVEGFAKVRESGIVVNLGRTTKVDVKLQTSEIEGEVVEVVATANPVMSTESTQATTVFTFEKAAQTPIFHQVERIASQAAGVGPGTRPSTRGGLARFSKFYVDGMDTTDITDGSITAPMNYDAVDQFEVITGGFDAQYNALGAVTNAVTKSGSNAFKYDLNLTASPPWMTAQNAVPGSQPGFIGVYGADNQTKLPQSYFYSPVAVLSGPLVKDKLWFSISGQANFNRRESLVSTFYSPQEVRGTDTQTTLFRAKLTWQATPNDRISLAFNYDHNTIDNVIGNSAVTLDAEQKIDRGGFFLIANYDHQFTDTLLLQVQAGVTQKEVDQGGEKSTGLVSHTDSTQRVTQFAAGSISSDNPGNFLNESKQRFQFDPTLTWKLGAHHLKGGVQLSAQRSVQLQGVTTTQRYNDRSGVCDPTNAATFAFCNQHVDFYNSDGQLAPQRSFGAVTSMGLFLQDRWELNRYFTVMGGMRFDQGWLSGNGGARVATLTGYGPRLGATWDLMGDRKTIVTAHYGRSNDVGNILVAQHANPALTQVTATFGNGTFPNCQLNVQMAGCQQTGGNRSIERSAPPSVDEVAVGIKREIFDSSVIGLDFTYRRYSNMWADEETNRIYDPTGARVVGYANGSAQSILVAHTTKQAWREYKGVDVWVQATPGKFDILASYTLSFATGTVDDYFSGLLLNPRYTKFYEGNVSDDRRHTFKASVAYRTSFGLDLGLRVQFYTGTPMWETFPNPTPGETQRVIRSPRGTGYPNDTTTGTPNLNDPTQWSELRNPDQLTIDLQVRYNVGQLFELKQTRIELIGLVVNALNSTTPTALTDAYTPGATNRFGTAVSRVAPLQGELIVRVRN